MSEAASAVSESDALHARVRAFARSAAACESFDELALAIAHFQVRHSKALARLVALHGASLASVDALPAVPADAFRLSRVAVHPPELDVARFLSSGTTASERSLHAFRTTQTYRELALQFGRSALLGPAHTRLTAVALAASPGDPPTSSLSFMLGVFMQELDGRGLCGAAFQLDAADRWLLGSKGVDVDGLKRAAAIAHSRGEPLLLLATSLSLLALLSALEGATLALPGGSVVMLTGGNKGLRVSVDAQSLRREVGSALAVPEAALVSEYGMTELSSQMYEGTLPGGNLRGPRDVYLAPPWLRVTPVDAVTLMPVAPGQVGLARFVDLGNVDSAIAVVTADRIRARGAGIELLGRDPSAVPRGCSLSVEALLDPRLDATGRP